MNKEICIQCGEMMGNSSHHVYGFPLHIRCEKLINRMSKEDFDKWYNARNPKKEN